MPFNVRKINSPEELDLFTDEQVNVSKMVELSGPQVFVNVSAKMVHQSLEVLMHFPLDHYQRAAFEAKRLADSSDSGAARMLADTLWIAVDMLQRLQEATMASGKVMLERGEVDNPGFHENMKESMRAWEEEGRG